MKRNNASKIQNWIGDLCITPNSGTAEWPAHICAHDLCGLGQQFMIVVNNGPTSRYML